MNDQLRLRRMTGVRCYHNEINKPAHPTIEQYEVERRMEAGNGGR